GIELNLNRAQFFDATQICDGARDGCATFGERNEAIKCIGRFYDFFAEGENEFTKLFPREVFVRLAMNGCGRHTSSSFGLRAAPRNARKSAWGLSGVDLYSGWPCVPTKNGCISLGSSTSSTRFSFTDRPE